MLSKDFQSILVSPAMSWTVKVRVLIWRVLGSAVISLDRSLEHARSITASPPCAFRAYCIVRWNPAGLQVSAVHETVYKPAVETRTIVSVDGHALIFLDGPQRISTNVYAELFPDKSRQSEELCAISQV